MLLKPQDIMVVLKLLNTDPAWSYAILADQLFLSASETHAAVQRARRCQLLWQPPGQPKPAPNTRYLKDFLIHGLPRILPMEFGAPTRGWATSFAAEPIKSALDVFTSAPPPVWPDPAGPDRGTAAPPIYPTAPKAAALDPKLKEHLVIVDALRDRQVRVQTVARQLLESRLSQTALPVT